MKSSARKIFHPEYYVYNMSGNVDIYKEIAVKLCYTIVVH